MMNAVVKTILDGLVEILVVAVLSYGGLALAKVKGYVKSKTSHKQYELMSHIAHDIYQYVEREYKDSNGQFKFNVASQIFDEQMQRLKLPYDAMDFKVQVEKVIRQEKELW